MNKCINIDETIKKATKEAIKEYDKEKTAEQRSKVLHNTRLLLKHYNDFQSHVENAVDSINESNEELRDELDMDTDDIYILSIKRSKVKTLIMIAHIDMAMELLEKREAKMCSSEKYEALKMLYIDEVPYEGIVKYFNCGANTPRRWINEMIEELSIYLFGIDGLKSQLV